MVEEKGNVNDAAGAALPIVMAGACFPHAYPSLATYGRPSKYVCESMARFFSCNQIKATSLGGRLISRELLGILKCVRGRIQTEVPTVTWAHKVYQGLKQQILTFDLLPGTQLQELSLCKVWGVSRTPVREALAMLEADGLVERSIGRSYSVAQIRRQEMFDAYEVRLWIEPKAAAQAATKIDDRTLEELRAVAARMPVGARSREKYALAEDTDIELHRLILVASNNQVAHDFVMQARQIARRASYMVPPAQFMWNSNEHTDIINAISKKDSELAERLMRFHIESAIERLFGHPIEETQVVRPD